MPETTNIAPPSPLMTMPHDILNIFFGNSGAKNPPKPLDTKSKIRLASTCRALSALYQPEQTLSPYLLLGDAPEKITAAHAVLKAKLAAGMTASQALFAAAKAGDYYQVVLAVCRYNAKITHCETHADVLTEKEVTALHVAGNQGDVNIVRFLLQIAQAQGIDFAAAAGASKYTPTALQVAVVAATLQHQNNQTPSTTDYPTVIQALLTAGFNADASCTLQKGRSARVIAEQSGQQELLRVFCPSSSSAPSLTIRNT